MSARAPFEQNTPGGQDLLMGHTISPVTAAEDPLTGASQAVLAVWKLDPAFDPVDDADVDNVWPITGVTDGSGGSFEVAGDLSEIIYPGMSIAITASTGNDGTYKVTSVAFATGTTTITVLSVPDATVDGTLTLLVPYHALDSGARICFSNRDTSATAEPYTLAIIAKCRAMREYHWLVLGCEANEP